VRHHRAVEAVTVPGVGASRLSALHVVQDQHQVSIARLHATAMGRAHGLDTTAVDRLGSAVTELATNIAHHVGTGHIVLRAVGEYATGSIEILALDKGSGIADMGRAMRQGGLASVKQLADLFDIYSQVGRGTAVVAHVGAQTGQSSTRGYAESVMHECVGVVCVPLDGEEECGDAWAVEAMPGRLAALLVDGLGHGPGAAVAALAAMSAFHDAAAEAPEIMLRAMHTALRPTRGAALSVTVVDQSTQTARFCGVGNVDGRVVTVDTNRHLIPQNGIVGHTMPRVKAGDVPWPTDARLVMHSDGISSRWRADRYPGLLARHPALLAGVLFRDFGRDRDDATVLVLRNCLPAISG
jgi:anti-sigma regulatory factor (Ser/Thr protein kinase)